jgi:hypothetical protein
MSQKCGLCRAEVPEGAPECPSCGREMKPPPRSQTIVLGVVVIGVMGMLFVTLALAGRRAEASWVDGWTEVGGARLAAERCVPGRAWTPPFWGAALVGGKGLVALRLRRDHAGQTEAVLGTRESTSAPWHEVTLTPSACPSLSLTLKHALPWHGGRRGARRYSGKAVFSCTLPDGRAARGNLKFGDCR